MVTKAAECHRRLGHEVFRRLADLNRKCLLGGDDPSPDAFVQALEQKACEPSVLGKLRHIFASTSRAVPRAAFTPATCGSRGPATRGLPKHGDR
jgi:hypothetical protein